MTPTTYTSTTDILKEAGFYHNQQGDKLVGATDGVNKTFFATYKNIQGGVGGVTVLVNDVKVDVANVGSLSGQITLAVAPPINAIVLADYYYSAVDTDFVTKIRAEAQAYIDSFMKGYDPCSPYSSGNVPEVIQQVCRLYAAGLLLARDYGFNSDTELTSKDGYKKMAFAKETLNDFREAGGLCGGDSEDEVDGGISSAAAGSEGDYFKRDLNDECGDSCFDRGY
jgi:hypothetical protein